MSLPTVTVVMEPGQAPFVAVNGTRVDGVRTVGFLAGLPTEVPIVRVEVAAGRLEVEGVALVQAIDVADVGVHVREWLRMLDAREVERAVLDGADLTCSLGERWIDTLVKIAGGE